MNRTFGTPKLWALMLLAPVLVACGSDNSGSDNAAEEKSMLDSAVDAAKDTAGSAADAMGDAADSVAEAAGDAADKAGDMVDGAREAAGSAATAAGDAADAAADKAGEMVDGARDAAGAAADKAGDMVDSARDAAGSAATAVGDAASAATDKAAAAMDSAKDMASDAVATVTDGPCSLTITAGDAMAYSTNALTAPSSCDKITVTLTHTGNLPKAAMGHNWVLLPADAADAVAPTGMSAGVDGNYLPSDDRIVAATKLVGGGESSSVTFDASSLKAGTDYVFICTFPGHWTIMKGTFSIG